MGKRGGAGAGARLAGASVSLPRLVVQLRLDESLVRLPDSAAVSGSSKWSFRLSSLAD